MTYRIEDKDKKTSNLLDWDKVIYDIVQTNSHKYSVKNSQISDIIGEEEWVDGEINKLSNIGSHRIVNLSFRAKKKEKKNNTQSLLGDLSTHNKKAKKKGTECVCVCVSDLQLRLDYCKCMRYQSPVPSR
jgi:hypothetical protein